MKPPEGWQLFSMDDIDYSAFRRVVGSTELIITQYYDECAPPQTATEPCCVIASNRFTGDIYVEEYADNLAQALQWADAYVARTASPPPLVN